LFSTEGGGIAVSSGGLFWATPTPSQFGFYNQVTGAFNNVANPFKPVGGAYGALEIDGSGVLYGLDLAAGVVKSTHLVTINTTSSVGTVTDIGATINALDAIAFRIIPEPGTATLAGMAALSVIAGPRRRSVVAR
jgi:hypothetical protein